MIRIRPLGVLSHSGRIWEAFPAEHLMAGRKESEATVLRKGAGYGRSLLPLGVGLAPGAGAVSLSVVEKRATNHERFPRHAADEADKSAQGILEVFEHGRYATWLRDTIVCLRLICAAVGSSLQQK